MEKKRIIWLDIARGLAMLCVIYGHVGSRRWIYTWHMPAFFLITAILLSINTNWKQMTFRELFVKDAKSLLYPYLVFGMIEVIIKCFSSSVKAALIGLFHLCILDGLGALWFLSALFIARQLFFQLMKRTQKREVIVVCAVIAIVVTSIISTALGRFDLQSRTMRLLYCFLNIYNRSVIGFIFLVLGFAGADYLRCVRLNSLTKGIGLVCMLFFSVFFFRYNSAELRFSTIGNPLLFYPLAIAGSVFIFILSDFLSRFHLSEVIRFMGCNSIVFLVTHIQVRNLLEFLFDIDRKKSAVLLFLMLVAVEYGVTWVIIRYLSWLYRFPIIPTVGKNGRPDKA